MTDILWSAYPYLCFTLFFTVPIIRMAFRPYSWTTRASGLFNTGFLGLASLLLHWGLAFVLVGHVAGWIGGVLGYASWITFFYWVGLIGGISTLAGCVMALLRRMNVPEARAMSQTDDYIVLLFLIAILGLGLYQVLIDQIFGVSYTVGAWFASVWAFSPQPELMVSAGLVTQLHVIIALGFLAYFPFTKMVHLWTLPVNYFVRPYQSMRTVRLWAQRQWEFSLRSDKSYLVYTLAFFLVSAFVISLFLGTPTLSGYQEAATRQSEVNPDLTGYALYVSQCARCHGNSGAGDGPGANSPTFAALPRNLVAGDYRFVSTNNGVASDADLYRIAAEGLPSAGMPAFKELSEPQLLSLVEVMGFLWKDRPEPGETILIEARPPSAEEDTALGKELYVDLCAMCHGEQGRGDGEAAEFALDAQGNIVRPADFTKGKLKAGRDPQQLYLRIMAGIPGDDSDWLMPPHDFLTTEEVWALIDYLESEILPEAEVAAISTNILLTDRGQN
jgi:nitrate reductase gamma subunit